MCSLALRLPGDTHPVGRGRRPLCDRRRCRDRDRRPLLVVGARRGRGGSQIGAETWRVLSEPTASRTRMQDSKHEGGWVAEISAWVTLTRRVWYRG
jgi:hypothetical protein